MKKILVPYTVYSVEDHKTVSNLLEEGILLALPVAGDCPTDLEHSIQYIRQYEVTEASPEGYKLGSRDIYQYIAVRDIEESTGANDFLVHELKKALAIKSKPTRRMRVGAIIHAALSQLTLHEAADIYESIRQKDLR